MNESWRRARGMPPSEAFAHGTRARYVCGCRCDPCRGANRRYYHERQGRGRELAREIVATGPPVPQLWTGPDGRKRFRVYTRGCPGVAGEPCPRRAHLRRDSKGGVCRTCRDRLAWNGLVSASRARVHLLRLSRQGVGYKAVAAASDVSPTILLAIRTGRRRQIRAATERAILAVDAGARADHSLVGARRLWRLVARLIEKEGFSKAEIARRLGYRRPALQFRRGRVLASSVAKVERFYRLMTEVA